MAKIKLRYGRILSKKLEAEMNENLARALGVKPSLVDRALEMARVKIRGNGHEDISVER